MKFKIQREKKPVAVLELKHLGGGDWEIEWLFTDKNHRGKKLATRLIEKAKAYVAEKGNLLVGYLEPRDGLTYDQMVAWHKRLGFVCGWYNFHGFRCKSKRVMMWRPQ